MSQMETGNQKSRLSRYWPIILILLVPPMLLAIIVIDFRAFKRPQSQLKRLPLAEGIYLSAGWEDENNLLVAYRPPDYIEWEHGLWQVSLETNEMTYLNLQDDKNCKARRLEMPEKLPDGRIGYLLRCLSDNFREMSHILAYDLGSNEVVTLASGQWLGLVEIDPLSGNYSWTPDLKLLYVAEGGSDPVRVVYQGQRTNLDFVEVDPVLSTGLNYEFGIVAAPVGDKLALIGADEPTLLALFRVMASRPVQSYHLYLMNQSLTSGERLVRDIELPSVPAWSPDGQWLVISGVLGNIVKTEGLWLVHSESGQLVLLAKGKFHRPAWSPSGEKIIVLLAKSQFAKPDGIGVVEVGTLVD